jgi:hypothetical protein
LGQGTAITGVTAVIGTCNDALVCKNPDVVVFRNGAEMQSRKLLLIHVELQAIQIWRFRSDTMITYGNNEITCGNSYSTLYGEG